MSLISLLIALAIVGFLAWLILQIPMPDLYRKIVIAILCFVLIIWVLQQFGANTGLPTIRLR